MVNFDRPQILVGDDEAALDPRPADDRAADVHAGQVAKGKNLAGFNAAIARQIMRYFYRADVILDQDCTALSARATEQGAADGEACEAADGGFDQAGISSRPAPHVVQDFYRADVVFAENLAAVRGRAADEGAADEYAGNAAAVAIKNAGDQARSAHDVVPDAHRADRAVADDLAGVTGRAPDERAADENRANPAVHAPGDAEAGGIDIAFYKECAKRTEDGA